MKDQEFSNSYEDFEAQLQLINRPIPALPSNNVEKTTMAIPINPPLEGDLSDSFFDLSQ